MSPRICQRLTKSVNCRVDIFRRTKIAPFHFGAIANNIGDIAQLCWDIPFNGNSRVGGMIDREFDQSSIFGNEIANGFNGGGARWLVDTSAAPAEVLLKL